MDWVDVSGYHGRLESFWLANCEFGYGNRKLRYYCSDTPIVKLFKIFVFNRPGVSTKIGETRDKMFLCVDQRYFLRHQRGWCIWGAGIAQWRQRSPPTNVSRVRLSALASHVGWVCCWFSPKGFSPKGFSPKGFSPKGFSPKGFSPKGFSPKGFSPKGFFPQGFFPQGFSPQGFFSRFFGFPLLNKTNISKFQCHRSGLVWKPAKSGWCRFLSVVYFWVAIPFVVVLFYLARWFIGLRNIANEEVLEIDLSVSLERFQINLEHHLESGNRRPTVAIGLLQQLVTWPIIAKLLAAAKWISELQRACSK